MISNLIQGVIVRVFAPGEPCKQPVDVPEPLLYEFVKLSQVVTVWPLTACGLLVRNCILHVSFAQAALAPASAPRIDSPRRAGRGPARPCPSIHPPAALGRLTQRPLR